MVWVLTQGVYNMLQLWNPFVNVTNVNKSDRGITTKDYFDRLWENTMIDFFNDFYYPIKSLSIESKKNEDGTMSLFLDVPGITTEDISIEVSDGIISIKAERKNRSSELVINKSFTVPDGYDEESLKAELANGVLILTLAPKPEIKKQSKKIEVKCTK
jgi:HSP20 family molecular chaperone IbpA